MLKKKMCSTHWGKAILGIALAGAGVIILLSVVLPALSAHDSVAVDWSEFKAPLRGRFFAEVYFTK